MKILLVFTACSTFAIIIANQTVTDAESAHRACLVQEGATEEDLSSLLNGTIPETKAEKCLSACLGETYGTVSNQLMARGGVDLIILHQIVNNSLSAYGFYEFVKPQVGNDTEKLKIVMEIVKICGRVYDDDRCEASAKIHECIANLTQFC